MTIISIFTKKNVRKIIVSVTNDLVTDNRVHKVCASLSEIGFDILLVGRKLPYSVPVSRVYKTCRFHLLFKKGFLFYAEYNFRLFLFLLFRKADIFLANDLDALPANYIVSKLKGKVLVYDSHEYFTEVPELIGRRRVRNTWLWLEKRMVPKITHAYTVCESLANEYKSKYGVAFQVVRNVPSIKTKTESGLPISLPENKKIIIYQGALNVGRGIEAVISSMKFLSDLVFVIVGEGDITDKLKLLARSEGVEERVIFAGRIPFEQLSAITKNADLGISLEENLGLNYYYSLPNKIFDYIHAQVPVLASDLPEQKKIVEGFNVGKCTLEKDPAKLAEIIHQMMNDEEKRKEWKYNLAKATQELCWEKEEKTLQKIFENL
jgi:glycosyltransferase involved in cell wall biosynthesis